MNKLKQTLDALLYSNIFIGICALALTFTNQLTIEGTIHLDNVCWFIFFSTIFTYSFFKFREPNAVDGTLHQTWAANHPQLSRNIQLISLLATAAFFITLTRRMQLIAMALALVTALYGYIPIPFTSNKARLRNFGLLKTAFVALVWSVTTVAIPLANEYTDPASFTFLLARRFFFIFCLTLVFEIKDMASDRLQGLKTIPMLVGVPNTKLLAQGILLALMLGITLQYFLFDISVYNMLAINLSLLVSIVCIQPLDEETGEWWYYLVLDGMMIAQFALVYGAVKLFE